MAKKEKLTTSQIDGVQYKRAKMWQIALSQLTGAGQMCFYMLMTYATYIGNVNYGILVAITGVIITASRIFDGITDPLCVLSSLSGSTPNSARSASLCSWAGASWHWPRP